ncbi:MAG TPA: glutamate--tRNA ligase, partial [Longimicrobiaceae bacterium]|nr:glutamate--tRNA ligase [Longimicrobiaceae bacterium]
MTNPAVPRVRFAPSPTGYLHVGGARTALFNWLFARKEGGVFVLRIEDTDRDRSSDEMTEAILDGLRWLGMDWDEGPFHQADGFDRHRSDVERLVKEGKAYRCFCPPEDRQLRREDAEAAAGTGAYRYDRRCAQLSAAAAAGRAATGEPHAVRFHVPPGETTWEDVVHGSTRYDNKDIEDFILLRSDGTPIYNLAVVSDDIEMGITHVIRGDDHLSNTPKQILLYRAYGAPEPLFAHLPMILGADGKRLSKRHGATAVGEYRNLGILPHALVNFLALLGWNPGDDQELMQEHELIARFSLDRINKKSAIFDPEKLEWMNGQHIQMTPAHDLVELIAPQLIGAGLTTEVEIAERADWFAETVELLKPRGRTVHALAEQARIFLAPALDYDPAAVEKQWKDPTPVSERLEAVARTLDGLEPWEPASIEEALRATAERLGVGFGKLVQPLRLALTGGLASPGIDQVVLLLGKATVRARIDAAKAYLAAASPGD